MSGSSPPDADREVDEDVEREEDAHEDEEDDDTPRLLLAQLKDLGAPLEARLLRDYGTRPVWFMLEMDAEFSTVFERLPEDPMPKGHVDAVMGAIRQFATKSNEALQLSLGITDAIAFGFHVDASLDRVRGAFEADGFDIVGTIRDGEIELDEEDED